MLVGLLTICGFAFLIWLTYRTIKENPEAFSKENLGHSFSTLGFLALMLIFVVGLTVYLLRQGT